MAVNTHLKKIGTGGQRGHAPLGCLPLWGREGVTLAIALSALWEGILQSRKNRSFYDLSDSVEKLLQSPDVPHLDSVIQ
jgi:hypothetical protein